MVQFVPVTKDRHAGKRWLRFSSYRFASAEAVAPIVGIETARAALAMPLAFTEESGRYTLVAVLSLTPGRNMLVAPDGRWLGEYIPACYRGYPFRVFARQGNDEAILCVDEGGGLVVEASSAGEEFFDQAGAVSPAMQPVVRLLTEMESSRKATDLAVAALAQAGVIRPWPIAVKTEHGEKPLGGLHRIDEGALKALPDEAFLKLRATSALPVAYAQLFSAGQLGVFERLARVQAQLAPPPAGPLPESLDLLFGMQHEDVIQFE